MDRRRLFGLATLPLLGWRPARALDAPSGGVLLTVTGRLGHTNRDAQAVFDMAMLERLPQASFTTATPWYSQPRKFTGPLLRELMAAVGTPRPQRLRAIALNDYVVEIPGEDIHRFDVMLARLLDDKPMPVRDKGPLFIIYPFDSQPQLRNALYYSRCAWQLKAIEVS